MKSGGEESTQIAPPGRLSTTVLQGGAWLGFSALAQAILQIVIFAVLARLLTPSDFGLVAVAGIFIDLASGVAALGTSQALVQRQELSAHHIRAAFWISVLMGGAMTALLFACSRLLATILGSPASAPLIAALSITFLIRAFAFVPEGLAARRFDFRILALRQIVAYVVGYGIVGVGSALVGAGPWALVYAQLTQVGLASFLLIAAIRFDWHPTLDRAAYRAILGFGSGFSVARIASSFANQVDRAIVSMNASSAAVGLYTRAIQTTRYPTTLVGQVIEDVLFPSFAGVQADRARLEAAFYRALGSIFVVLTPVAVFFCLASEPITDILLGSQWGGVAALIVVFGVAIPLRSAQRIASALLRSIGRSWLVASLQVALLMLTAVGAFLGVRHGLLGAAIGVTGAFAIHYILLLISTMIALKLKASKLLLRHFAGVHLSILVTIGSGGPLLLLASYPPWLGIVSACASGGLVVLLAVLIRPRIFLGADGQWLVSLLLSKLPPRCRRQIAVSRLARKVSS